MCIGIYELLRNRKPRLILPHLKVGVRRLGGDGDSSSDLVGLRSLEFISSRSFAAAQPSGKIDLPTRRSSNCVQHSLSSSDLLFCLYAQFKSKQINASFPGSYQPDEPRLFSRAISRSCSEPEKATPTCTP